MTCEYLTGEGVIVSVWGEPTIADIDIGMSCLQAVYEKTRSPVLYITRVPSNAPPPDSSVRHYLYSKMPHITTMCDAYHVVLEGTGFVAAMKRGILLSIFQISHRRNTFYVHSSVEEVIVKLPQPRRSVVCALICQAELKGSWSRMPARTRVA